MLSACVVALLVLAVLPVRAAEPLFNLTIISKDGASKSITSAKLRIMSSRGYMSGRTCQWFEGVDITDPVVPPFGVQIDTTPVKWSLLNRIDWLDSKWQGNRELELAKLTYRDGKTAEVFIFFDKSDTLSPLLFCISGTMRLNGKDYQVKIDEDFKSLIINR
jgi:hypothetical protein